MKSRKESEKRLYKAICAALGEDLDSPACRTAIEKLKGNEHCRVIFDTVRQTVALYRHRETAQSIPPDVATRLMECLKLEAHSARSNEPPK